MAVYDKENGGYTDNANKLSKEFSSLVEGLILKYMNEQNMTVEEIKYITGNDIQRICLRNAVENRVNKSKGKIKC